MQDSLPVGDLPYKIPAYMSPSSIGTFNQCPMRYKYAKLDKIPEPSTEAQVLGSFVHEVLEDLFRLPSEERTEPASRKLAKDLWDKKWADEFFDLNERCDDNEFRWKAWWCIENYFLMEDPTSFDAGGIEAKMNGDILGVPIYGIIDRWTLENDKIVISDYLKSGQFAKYDVTEDLVDKVSNDVKSTWDELVVSCESGEFETRTGPLCNWCNYKRICPAWRK
jgi:putative RecB family exonuclease